MAFAAPLAIGASLFQGVAAIQQGEAQAHALKVQGAQQQQEYEIDAQNTKIAAEQSQAYRLEQLQKTIGSMRATVASRGLDLASPSAGALEDAAQTQTRRAIAIGNFNAQQTSGNDRLAGQVAVSQAAMKASMARAAGYTSGIGSFFKAATTANSAYG